MKKDLFSSIAVVILITAPVVVLHAPDLQAQDEPNARIEKRFHNIYRKYNQTPTSENNWKDVLQKTGDTNYTVQKGDTLWDISETFFGDPYFWPKIWSVNSQITNPHEILPKGVVQFVPGTAQEPPAMGLTDPKTEENQKKEEAAVPVAEAKPAVEEEGVNLMPDAPKQKFRFHDDIDFSKITIPPPARPSRPAAKIPASLPRYIYYRDSVKDFEIEISPIVRNDSPQPFYVSYFATDSEPNNIGEIVQIENGSVGAGEGSMVLVDVENAQPGMRLMVFEPMGSIKGGSGYANRVQGQIELIQIVNASKGIWRARVIKSLNLITKDAKLANEELPSTVAADGQMTPISTKITGGQFDRGRNLFGPYNVVYLDAGSGGGIQVGTHLPVYRNPKIRVPNSLISENPAEIGELQVVRVDNDVATAVVLRVVDDIRVGDVCSPSL